MLGPRALLVACAALAAAAAPAPAPAAASAAAPRLTPDNRRTYCTVILTGQVTNQEPHELKSVHITARDSIVYIPDEVSKLGGTLAGNEVTVCNWAGTGLPTLSPPEEGLSPVTIHVPKGAPYHNLELFVLQYVQPFYGSQG